MYVTPEYVLGAVQLDGPVSLEVYATCAGDDRVGAPLHVGSGTPGRLIDYDPVLRSGRECHVSVDHGNARPVAVIDLVPPLRGNGVALLNVSVFVPVWIVQIALLLSSHALSESIVSL